MKIPNLKVIRHALPENSNASAMNHITATALVHWFTMRVVKTAATRQQENATLIPTTTMVTAQTATIVILIRAIFQILQMTTLILTPIRIPTQSRAPKKEHSGATVIYNRNVLTAIGELWWNASMTAIQ